MSETPIVGNDQNNNNQKADKKETTCATGLCPYYFLALNSLSNVQLPQQVSDLLLWRNPKLTGAVFGSSFVVLLSLASFSLLTVIGTLLVLASSVFGAYRFYLALLFRIKGVKDDTFEKLSALDVSLPKDKIEELVKLLGSDLNCLINSLRSILFWENVSTSVKAFVGFYMIYWVGSIFNTLTLFIIVLVGAFSLPKVYQLYKKQIDQALEKATAASHCFAKQVMAKLPFLNKKKTQ